MNAFLIMMRSKIYEIRFPGQKDPATRYCKGLEKSEVMLSLFVEDLSGR